MADYSEALAYVESIETNSIDSIVTDPAQIDSSLDPRDLLRAWASASASASEERSSDPVLSLWGECLRVLKPGGHAVVFAGVRSMDLLSLALRLAGFEIRDSIGYTYDLVGRVVWEPIILARRPLEGTVAQNVLSWGVGGLNIEESRVEADWENDPSKRDFGYGWDSTGEKKQKFKDACSSYGKGDKRLTSWSPTKNRWPANLIHSGSSTILSQFPANVKGGTWNRTAGARHFNNEGDPTHYQTSGSDTSIGSAARFFYSTQSNQARPDSLVQYLTKLVTPPNGKTLDPFQSLTA